MANLKLKVEISPVPRISCMLTKACLVTKGRRYGSTVTVLTSRQIKRNQVRKRTSEGYESNILGIEHLHWHEIYAAPAIG